MPGSTAVCPRPAPLAFVAQPSTASLGLGLGSSSSSETMPDLNYLGLRLGGLHLGPRFRSARAGWKHSAHSSTDFPGTSLKFQPPRSSAPADEHAARLPFRLRAICLELQHAWCVLAQGRHSGPSYSVDGHRESGFTCTVSGFETRMPKKPPPSTALPPACCPVAHPLPVGKGTSVRFRDPVPNNNHAGQQSAGSAR